MDNVKIGAKVMEILVLLKTVGKKHFVWKLGYTLEIVITQSPDFFKDVSFHVSFHVKFDYVG